MDWILMYGLDHEVAKKEIEWDEMELLNLGFFAFCN